MTDLVEGDRLPLTIGAVAHGGHCVARIGGPHGQVVFVRHTLPGEEVVAEITEVHRGYLRADAVEITVPSPDRVTPPCPWAGPGRCGGCDLQHVAPSAQRDWKTAVVREQLRRLAGCTEHELDALGVRVEALPGGELGWRTRVRYTVDAGDRAGLLKHRSHEVVAIDRCRIAHPAIQSLDVTGRAWPASDAVAAVATTAGDVTVLDSAPVAADLLDEVEGTPLTGPETVRERAAGREWTIPAAGFWQIHPAAPDTLVGAVLDLLDPQPGETSWDLYGGAGLFAAALAGRTAGARVTLVESAPAAVAAARANLADLPQVEAVAARVDSALRRRRVTGPVDLVVLDPPRTGAGAPVVEGIVAAGPRAVAYVACDPAALARDVGTFRDAGWRLRALRAYDCFPMTQHVECVALLTR
ncbi:class I SAM-dependent RNA methyltransferase [Spirilliplanes yamanashiensis]|uniref:Putative RNA methyltransferase n=1 Tax=Spirilliplanes yamanashiensis TaxID=42233 RepID=A0A8J3Y4M4_9ACTN|nr:TRAM domain-containing protein [Spirilliplanes yamanashiensis]MDP9819507.1 tRNA/tmRNA/rRNA uracil-C5-methylase (TrmA/RlmC/RlmD family) [Spirilliplanes yamanashiensis]GIJ01671.1 putative RNA methyltransferase [Spirilliplanes yamanashiensis]